jgi:hypothetical protein
MFGYNRLFMKWSVWVASNDELNQERMRQFATGATRNADTERPDPEGFLSFRALDAYIQYMHKNRFQRDGTMRASDNWQLGIPQNAYAKSLFRHFLSWWATHRSLGRHLADRAIDSRRHRPMGVLDRECAKRGESGGMGAVDQQALDDYRDPELVEQLCALLFNVSGYLDQELQRPERNIGGHQQIDVSNLASTDDTRNSNDLLSMADYGRAIREAREKDLESIGEGTQSHSPANEPIAPKDDYPLVDDETDNFQRGV